MNIELIKEIYQEILAGTLNPERIQIAYFEITGNETPVAIRVKKNTIYSFVNNVLPSLPIELKEQGNGLWGDNMVTMEQMEKEGLTPFTNEPIKKKRLTKK